MMPPMTAQSPHLLSVDVEEWHHTEVMRRWLPPGAPRPSTVQTATQVLLDLFAENQVRATFFVLGQVARENPRLVRRIADAGHEVATHGDSHKRLGDLGPERFRQELRDSIRRLEDLAGRRVLGHRAASWSIRRATLWALPILEEEGLQYDSSINPCLDLACAPSRPYRVTGLRLVEVPPLAHWGIPAGGGFWLRVLPPGHTHRGLRRGPWGMVYVHPWEVDPTPPAAPLPWYARWLQEAGTRRTLPRLRDLLMRHSFAPVARVLEDLGDLPAWDPAGLAQDSPQAWNS